MLSILLWVLAALGAIFAAFVLYAGPLLWVFLRTSAVSLDPDLTIMLGGGGNSVILKSAQTKQFLIVDTKFGLGARKIKRHVRAARDYRITIVNTHAHIDHVGGNKLFSNARIITGGQETDANTVPPGKERELTFGDEIVKLYNACQGHTSNDLTVYFVKRRVLMTGDLVFHHWVPVAGKPGTGSIRGWIRALDHLLQTYPAATVVPGHGSLTDLTALEEQKAYFLSIVQAADDPLQLASLEKKYASYLTLPGMSRVKQVAAAFHQEKHG